MYDGVTDRERHMVDASLARRLAKWRRQTMVFLIGTVVG
jgi:hypothetical protein